MSSSENESDSPKSPKTDSAADATKKSEVVPKSKVADASEKEKKASKIEDTKDGSENKKSKVEESKGKETSDENKPEEKAKSKVEDKSKPEEKDKAEEKDKDEEKKDDEANSSSASNITVGSAVSGKNKSSQGKSTTKSSKKSSAGAASSKGPKIGFLGAGRMTDCIVRGLLKADKVSAKNMVVACKSTKNIDNFKTRGLKVSKRVYDLFGKERCDIVFLAVHGFVVRNCFKMGGTRPFPLATNYIPSRKSKYYLLSLIGGITLKDVKQVLVNPDNESPCNGVFHRLMLNSSTAYGIGLGALDVEIDSKKCAPVVRDVLNAIGKMEFLDEPYIDAACALGGNGMAIIYYFVSALSDGGFKMGLAKPTAIKLAAKTLHSAAMALLESNKNLAELKDNCCSPAGAAVHGLAVLEKQDTASGLQSAVETAFHRIKALCDVEP